LKKKREGNVKTKHSTIFPVKGKAATATAAAATTTTPSPFPFYNLVFSRPDFPIFRVLFTTDCLLIAFWPTVFAAFC